MTEEPTTHRRILIVDDEPDILDSVKRLLRKDYQVFVASTSEEAWDVLVKNDIQVIMSDQRMPRTSGVELLSQVRVAFPAIVRVLLTGYSNIDHVVDAINDGHVYRYISKPWDPGEFRSVVRQCFDRWDARAERALLIEELRNANTQLEERNRLLSQKNEELKTLDRLKDVFMEVVSHELNTPIAVILGYTFLLKRETLDTTNEVIQKAVAGIEGNGNRLKNISTTIFKMLEGSGSDELSLDSIALDSFLEGVRREVDVFLEKRDQTMQFQISADASELEGDRDKLRDVFLNLYTNAIKFSEDGEVIEVKSRADEDPGFLVVSVRDHGVGIPEEDRGQVLDAFFSTFQSQYHSSGAFEFGKRGIGLGLAVAQRFVEKHGGEILVESELDEGSTFHVRLPRRQRVVE